MPTSGAWTSGSVFLLSLFPGRQPKDEPSSKHILMSGVDTANPRNLARKDFDKRMKKVAEGATPAQQAGAFSPV
jgi:hypothetical protein